MVEHPNQSQQNIFAELMCFGPSFCPNLDFLIRLNRLPDVGGDDGLQPEPGGPDPHDARLVGVPVGEVDHAAAGVHVDAPRLVVPPQLNHLYRGYAILDQITTFISFLKTF